MKTFFYLMVTFGVFILTAHKTPETPSADRIQGTWELIHQFTYDGTAVTDTIFPTDGYRQIKMFYDGKVMWTRFVPKDSVEWFGYGNYIATDSSLVETLEYGSASMMRIVDTMRVFSFKLILQDQYYSQITLDNEGKPIFSENYKRLK